MDGLHAQHISSYMYVAAFVPPFLSSHHASIQFPHFLSPPAQPFLCSYPQIFTNFDRFPILRIMFGERKKNGFSYFAHNTHLVNKLELDSACDLQVHRLRKRDIIKKLKARKHDKKKSPLAIIEGIVTSFFDINGAFYY